MQELEEYSRYIEVADHRVWQWRHLFKSARKESYVIGEKGLDITLLDDLKLKHGVQISPYLTLFKTKFPRVLAEEEERGGEKIQNEEEKSQEEVLTIFDIEQEEDRIYKNIDFPIWKSLFNYTKEKKRDRKYVKKIFKYLQKLQEPQSDPNQEAKTKNNDGRVDNEGKIKVLQEIINYNNALEQDTVEFVNLPAKWIGINIPKEQKEHPHQSMEIPRCQYECKTSPAYRFASSFGQVKNILIRSNPLVVERHNSHEFSNDINNGASKISKATFGDVSPTNSAQGLDNGSITSDELIQSPQRISIKPSQDFLSIDTGNDILKKDSCILFEHKCPLQPIPISIKARVTLIVQYQTNEECLKALLRSNYQFLASTLEPNVMLRILALPDYSQYFSIDEIAARKRKSARMLNEKQRKDTEDRHANLTDELLDEMQTFRIKASAEVKGIKRSLYEQATTLNEGSNSNENFNDISTESSNMSLPKKNLDRDNEITSIEGSINSNLAWSLYNQLIHDIQLIEKELAYFKKQLSPILCKDDLTTENMLTYRKSLLHRLQKCGKKLENFESYVRQVLKKRVERAMAVPSLLDYTSCKPTRFTFFFQLLEENGNHMYKKIMEKAKKNGLTILLPQDTAFNGDSSNFEESCWGLHLIEGNHSSYDLLREKDILPTCDDMDMIMRCKNDTRSNLVTIYRKKELDPVLGTRIIEANILCKGNLMIHVVDRILYPGG